MPTSVIDTTFITPKDLSAKYTNATPESLERTAKELNQWPKAIRNTLSKLPEASLSFALAGDFREGGYQTQQEILTQLIPKTVIGGIMRHSPIIAADEAFVELGEYFTLYFFPSIIALLKNNFWSNICEIPHPEIIGHKIYDLEKQLGKTIKVGSINSKEIFIDKPLIKKIAFVQSLNFISIALATIALEIIVSAIRPLATKFIFKTDNFDEISGLKANNGHEKDGMPALAQAKNNIKNALIFMFCSIPAFLGLGSLLYKFGLHKKTNFFTGFSKRFALAPRSGLSRILLAVSIIPGAGLGYNLVARSVSEAKENFFRMIFLSWPSILFFKQTLGTALAGLVGYLSGVGNIVGNPFKTWHSEVIGKEAGLRDPLDLSFISLNKNKKGKFEGKITELSQIKALNEIQRNKLLEKIYFMKQKAPLYFFALPFGFLCAWLNYQRTVQMHKQQAEGKQASQSTHQYKGLRKIMEDFVDKLANFVYGIQQRNFVNESQKSAQSNNNFFANSSLVGK